jgi:predicted lipid-binding transport protein (Tim44 family)
VTASWESDVVRDLFVEGQSALPVCKACSRYINFQIAPETPTSSPSSSPSSSPIGNPSSNSTPLGAIVGGIVGGLAGLTMIGLILFFLIHRGRRHTSTRPAQKLNRTQLAQELQSTATITPKNPDPWYRSYLYPQQPPAEADSRMVPAELQVQSGYVGANER